jgi:hypothetical protein
MIGEHEKADPNNYLQLALDIADNINYRTGNWLKNGKALTLHGGQFGADFSGIKSAIDNKNFFSQMRGKVSNFSFAFKYFDANNALVPSSGDLSDVNVWENYLNNDLGLQELKLAVDENISAYPNHAHVIFVGDASDGLFTIKQKSYGETLIDALQSIFAANGWQGFIFGQPFDYRDLTETDKRGMWNYQGGVFSPQTPLDWWQDWQSTM